LASYSYARGDERPEFGDRSTFAGGVILAIVASLASILVLLGLIYAAGTPARHQRALAFAGCEPNLSPNGLPCTTVWQLEGRWTALTTSAVQQLNTDAATYAANESSNLAGAKAALTVELANAKAFDAKLTSFPFPPDVLARADALVGAIGARIKLIAEQVKSPTLAQMRSFDAQIDADGPVIQKDMSLVHAILYIRPTAAQEPIGGSCGGVCPGQGVQPIGNP
jgi:hypothetical protein